MNFETAKQIAEQKKQQFDFNTYKLQLITMQLAADEVREIAAYNTIFVLQNNPSGIKVESDYGLYDSTSELNEYMPEQQHIHRGQITVTNGSVFPLMVQFYKVIFN
jgi:hypothetical protein